MALTALMAISAPGWAQPASPMPDLSPLPGLGSATQPRNPYRGNPQAARIGKEIYDAHCLRCHGPDASGKGPGANLQLVGKFCRRITDAALQQRCEADADHFFMQSVLEGKVRLDHRYMPAWKDLLPQEAIWAVRSYAETAGAPKK